MLNAVKLSELLAKNVDPQLYPRMFIMSPNGTLMAYSTPVDIKELRDQAALISMAWKEHEIQLRTKQAQQQGSTGTSSKSGLETLTIEFQHNNIIVRAIQPSLLLVLVGGVPPSRRTAFKVTAEAYEDPRYPPNDVPDSDLISTDRGEAPDAAAGEVEPLATKRAASIASHLSQKEKDMKVGALHIQRKKIDALTDFIRKDFDAKSFTMPDDTSFP